MRRINIFKADACVGLVGLLATSAYGQSEVRMGGGIAGACSNDGQCDDGDICNGSETCDVGSGQCQPGTPPFCYDGNDCTIDFCDTIGGCINDAAAADGDACGNQGDTDCSNPNSCLGGACDPNDEADGTSCDDGLTCTDGDTCTGGVCQGNGSRNCCDADCCEANGTPGCNVAGCQATICSIDPLCCNNSWDQICADQAVATCVVCGGTSDCCTPGPQNGCDAQSCEDCVCAIDFWCCAYPWNSVCVDEAEKFCSDSCPCDTEVSGTQCPYGDITSAKGLCIPNCTGVGTDVDFDDVLCALNGFANEADCSCADIAGAVETPCIPDGEINFDDILAVLNAFAGNSTCPNTCT